LRLRVCVRAGLGHYYRARPTCVPSALHQARITPLNCEDVERLERSDNNQ